MKIELKQLFSIVGESRDISYSIETDELSGGDTRAGITDRTFASPVCVKGRLYNRAGVVFLEYSVDFSLDIVCDRCLKQLRRAYHYDFRHIVVPELSSETGDNDDYIAANGESIDMNDIAVTDLLLQLPTKVLCREDCKGLCMVCGADLNEGGCEHTTASAE
ncbi:MAG: DUF177 domain-containing protein [Ruminococcus sp.]|nr:DUF177 domain-containing protein [Ruminococcus sp.]